METGGVLKNKKWCASQVRAHFYQTLVYFYRFPQYQHVVLYELCSYVCIHMYEGLFCFKYEKATFNVFRPNPDIKYFFQGRVSGLLFGSDRAEFRKSFPDIPSSGRVQNTPQSQDICRVQSSNHGYSRATNIVATFSNKISCNLLKQIELQLLKQI